jgi:hypothetical protein
MKGAGRIVIPGLAAFFLQNLKQCTNLSKAEIVFLCVCLM